MGISFNFDSEGFKRSFIDQGERLIAEGVVKTAREQGLASVDQVDIKLDDDDQGEFDVARIRAYAEEIWAEGS